MRSLAALLAGALLLTAGAGIAQTKAQKSEMPGKDQAKTAAAGTMATTAAAKPMTVTGELVELSCYLDHGGKGASHKACATQCIADGSPMGVLTSDGHLYLLTLSHANGDPYNQAKTMAAQTVKVTGPMHDRNGMQAIEVTGIEGVGTGG